MTLESDLQQLRQLKAQLAAMSGKKTRVTNPFWFPCVRMNEDHAQMSHPNLQQSIARGSKFQRQVEARLRQSPKPAVRMSLVDDKSMLETIVLINLSQPDALEDICTNIVTAGRAMNMQDLDIKNYLTDIKMPEFLIKKCLFGGQDQIDTSSLKEVPPPMATMSIEQSVSQPDVGVPLSTIAGRQRDAFNQSMTPAQIDAAVNGLMRRDRVDNKLRYKPACY